MLATIRRFATATNVKVTYPKLRTHQKSLPITLFQPGFQIESHCFYGISETTGIKTEVDEVQEMTTSLRMELPTSLARNPNFYAWVRMVRYPTVLEDLHQADRGYEDYKVCFDQKGNVQVIRTHHQLPNLSV